LSNPPAIRQNACEAKNHDVQAQNRGGGRESALLDAKLAGKCFSAGVSVAERKIEAAGETWFGATGEGSLLAGKQE
jgi:hypothetical protein